MGYKLGLSLIAAAVLEILTALIYAVESQTLMFLSFCVGLIYIFVGIRIIKERCRWDDLRASEIRWLKQHHEKERYKHRDKLREYTRNRIKSLEDMTWRLK